MLGKHGSPNIRRSLCQDLCPSCHPWRCRHWQAKIQARLDQDGNRQIRPIAAQTGHPGAVAWLTLRARLATATEAPVTSGIWGG